MLHGMLNSRNDLNILRIVVFPVTIYVVDLFIFSQSTSKLLLSYKSVLIRISSHIGEVMIRVDADKDIPMRCNATAAAPIRIFLTAANDTHVILSPSRCFAGTA